MMGRYISYIKTAVAIIDSYKGVIPFAVFIKQFFAADKKYGSRDRKTITSLCYNYFRMGFASTHLTTEERLVLATFLCMSEPDPLMERVNPGWNENARLPLAAKIAVANNGFTAGDIFPFKEMLSEGVDAAAYCLSFLVQPAVFLRIRPQYAAGTLSKLKKSGIPYRVINDACLQLPPGNNVEDVFTPDREVVIQDYNSQQVLNYLTTSEGVSWIAEFPERSCFSVWDCCAASGGKSILLQDIVRGKIKLTISDIRPGIVLNLHQRFKKAGIKEYNYFIADIGGAGSDLPVAEYDCIICDAPCTGSGTWSRTPEQLLFFKASIVEEYCEKQKRIVANAMPYLKKEGLFFYITCSVFKKENELIARFIQETFDCTLLQQEILKGYDKRADSMFVAVFKK